MSNPMNNPMDIVNEAINNLHTHNSLIAERAKFERLEREVKDLRIELAARASKCEELREAGDDLWYCLRHRNEDPTEAIEEWKDARNV